MSYQVFARKYRPQNFDEVVGQDHITRTLKNAVEQNRLAHAYLFVGPRGVGKTSTARILAKAINCIKGPTPNPCGVCDPCREIAMGNSLDVLEIDGASNNGVEQVRELRDNVRFAPAHAKFKIYIIDEVHMLSAAAFNALLKTLEEPPAHVKFIFATTEPQKVLATILSRCQRFDLRRIPTALIAGHLQLIAQKEKIALEDGAAQAIAKGAEGGLRDAESMLDQLVAFCGEKIAENDVLAVFGFTAQEIVAKLCAAILNRRCPEALGIVHEQAEAGRDFSRLTCDLIGHLRALLVLKADPGALSGELSTAALATATGQAAQIDMTRLIELIEQFAAAETRMKWAPNKKMHFEIAIIKAVQTLGQTTLDEVLDTLRALRNGEPAQLVKPQPVSAPPAAIKPAAVPERVAEIPVAKPAVTPPTVSAISPSEVWPQLLAEVRKQRPLMSSWIETGTALPSRHEDFVIGFPKDQALSMESVLRPNNRKLIEVILENLLGRPVNLKGEVRPELVVAPPPAVAPAKKTDPVAEFKDDPLIRKALEIFKGEIQSA